MRGFLAFLVIAPLALVALTLTLLQTQPVQDLVADLVTDYVPGVELQGLSGGPPASLTVAQLRLTDDTGAWLEVEGVSFRWNMWALLRGALIIEDAFVDRVAVNRLPPPGPSIEEPPPEAETVGEPLAIPQALLPIRVDRVGVGRLELAEKIIGQALVLQVLGSVAGDDGRTIDLNLGLQRLDVEGLGVEVAGTADLPNGTVDLSVDGLARSGLLPALAGDPRLSGAALELQAQGPFTDLAGRLGLVVDGIATTELDFTLGIGERLSAELDGRVAPAATNLQPAFAELLGDGIQLQLEAHAEGENLELATLLLDADWLRLAGSGSLREEALTADLTLDIEDLSALAPVLDQDVAGSLQAQLRASGTTRAPSANLDVDATGLRFATVAIASIRQDVTIDPDADGEGFRLALDGVVDGLDVAGPGGTFEERFDLQAEARFDGPEAIDLTSLRLAGRSVELDLTGGLEGTAITADGTVSIPDFAVFTPLAGQDLGGSAAIDLEAGGELAAPMAAVSLRMADVTGGPVRLATGQQQLNLQPGDGGLAVTADGRFEGLEIAAGDAVFEDDLTLAANAFLGEDGGGTVDRLTVDGDLLQLAGTAQLGRDGESLVADLKATVPDLAPFGALAAAELGGRVTLTAKASGALPLPEAEIALQLDELAAPGGLTVAQIQQEIRAEPLGDDQLGFTLDGRVDGIRLAVGDQAFEDSVALAARGTAGLAGDLDLESLTVTANSLDLNAAANLIAAEGSGDAQVELAVPALDAFAPLVGQPLTGRIDLSADASFADAFQTINGDLLLQGSELANLPAPADAVLGPEPTVRVNVATDSDGNIVARELQVDAAGLTVTGDGSFNPASGDLMAEIVARLPDLAPIGDGIGQPLAGEVEATVAAAGSMTTPEVSLGVTAAGLEAAGQRLESVRLDANAGGTLPDVTGDLALTATKPQGDDQVSSAFRYAGDSVAVSDLTIAGPGLNLAGSVSADLAAPTATGSLTGGASDLAALGRWVEQDLAGRLDLDLQLSTDAGQNVDLTLEAQGLRVPGVTIDRVETSIAGRDVMGSLGLNARADIRGVDAGAASVDELSVTAQGDLAGLDLSLATSGAIPQPFNLETAARVAMADGTTEVTVSRLDAGVAEVPIRLEQPLAVTLAGSEVTIRDLALQLGEGRLSGGGAIGGPTADFALALADLPLNTAEAFGAPPLAGTVELDLNAEGPAASPTVALNARLDGFELSELEEPEADLDVIVEALVRGGRATVNISTDGLGEPGLQVAADVPVGLALNPFTLDVPSPLPLEASVDGNIDLDRVSRIAGLDGLRVKGELLPDIDVSGTSTAPRLAGDVRLANALVEDLASGIHLEQIALDLQADGPALNLREFSAADGLGGSLKASGDVLVDPDAGLPMRIEVTLNDPALLQREDLFAVVGGEARVEGDLSALGVFGRFTVRRADIRIPDGGAAGFPTIEVVDITDGPPEDEEEEGTNAAEAIRLDVIVDIPGQVFVGGRGLESEWKGNIEVTETAAAPRIEGEIEYVRGRFVLLDRRFNITDGVVTLDGAWPPDPVIRFAAEAEIEDITTQVRVDGPALDPEISFNADSGIPEDEVLSLILFGRSTADINAFQALQLAAAVDNLAGNRTAEGFMTSIKGGLGLDTLEIGGDSPDKATLRAGTYVSEDVYVELEQGLDESSGAARVEVELTNDLDFVGRVREDSTGSLGLQWKFDY